MIWEDSLFCLLKSALKWIHCILLVLRSITSGTTAAPNNTKWCHPQQQVAAADSTLHHYVLLLHLQNNHLCPNMHISDLNVTELKQIADPLYSIRSVLHSNAPLILQILLQGSGKQKKEDSHQTGMFSVFYKIIYGRQNVCLCCFTCL